MQFESSWSLLLVVFIAAAYFIRLKYYRRSAIKYSTAEHIRKITPSLRAKLVNLPLYLRAAVLILLVLVLARPQQGKEKVYDVSEGIAIEMVVDRSSSMAAEMDFDGRKMNRLEVVKRVFREFVEGSGSLEGRDGDLIGLISFAGYADTACPLTLAYGALDQMLTNVTLVTDKNEDGTAIGDAIALAAARLKTAEQVMNKQSEEKKKTFEIKSKIIILLTDGQNTAGKRAPMEAAELAKEWGVKVYTIGVGGKEGLLRQSGIFGNFLMRAGQGVDKKTLSAIAESTGGIFRMAEDADAMREIYEEINELEKSEVQSVRYMDYRELFQPLLSVAMLLLMLEILLSCTYLRRAP